MFPLYSSSFDDIANDYSIGIDFYSISIFVVLDDVEKDGLEVEENGDGLFGDVVDVVELFDAVSFDVVGGVDR